MPQAFMHEDCDFPTVRAVNGLRKQMQPICCHWAKVLQSTHARALCMQEHCVRGAHQSDSAHEKRFCILKSHCSLVGWDGWHNCIGWRVHHWEVVPNMPCSSQRACKAGLPWRQEHQLLILLQLPAASLMTAPDILQGQWTIKGSRP